MAKGYTQPGPQSSGVWLVAFPNGGAGLYSRSSLPPPDGQIQYYFLGGSVSQINDRILTALPKFSQTQNTEQIPHLDGPSLQAILSGTPMGIAGSIPLTPGTGQPKIPGAAPGAKYPTASGPFGGLAAAIQSVADAMKWIAWLFHPRNLLRAVEFVTGVALIGFGLWAAVQARGERQEGFSTSEGALGRSGLGRVARELGRAASGPEGRAAMGKPRRAPHRTQRLARERGREAATRPARHRRP